MRHIALYTTCIALVNGGHLLHIRVDHMNPGSEFQAKQVQWTFGCPQTSSCDDANIIGSRQTLVHLTNIFVFYFESFTLCLFECVLSL
jgi:hypothetical protein